MSEELEPLAALVERESGIRLRPNQFASLGAALQRAHPELGARALLAQAADPAVGPELVARLLDEVTVKETTFMRDQGQLESIPWRSLLDGAGGRELRVWSAGCATGEEPYTLALLAAEHLGPGRPPVSVLATDLSEAALAAARAGRYRPRAVSALEPAHVNRYFAECDGLYVVGPELRELVEFRRHNLIRDPAPPAGEAAFDLVLCRNVLIYFDLTTVEIVLTSLERAVTPAGMLIVGAADALCGVAGRMASRERPKPHPPEGRPLRRPLGRPKRRPRDEVVAAALDAANHGRVTEALDHASHLLSDDPLDADAHFVQGMVELEAGMPADAVRSLRRALYADPTFGLAAFTLGRACDAAGDAPAARRAYKQALRTLEPQDARHGVLLQHIDLGDVAAACQARLAALR